MSKRKESCIMKNAIGILGGMGPEASVYMYKILIDLSISQFGAKNNDDFPEIILDSVPVPDFISNSDKKTIALKMLEDRVIALNALPLLCIGIACNTAHLILPDLQTVSNVPFVSMIEAVAGEIEPTSKKIGVLGTPSTLKSGMYQDELAKRNIEALIPDTSKLGKIECMIRNVIAGKQNTNDSNILVNVASELVRQGAEGIILGCTELSLVFPETFHVPTYNSVSILAQSLLHRFYN